MTIETTRTALPGGARWRSLTGVGLAVLLGLTTNACRETLRAPPPGPIVTPDRIDAGRGGAGGSPSGTGGRAVPGTGGASGAGATDAADAPDSEAEDARPPSDVPVTCEPACRADEVCVDGQCVSPCLPGQTNCPTTGCSDLPTDPMNCGGCGKACVAGQFCSGGQCVNACRDGETRCDQSCVNLDSNTKNCGICGRACAGAEACVGRTCTCVAPNQICGGTCTDVRNNRNHCGRCNNKCPGDLVCNGTTCGCPGGRRACPNNSQKCVANLDDCCPGEQSWCGNVNRCVDLRSDRNHCNSCTTVCPGDDVCINRKCICPPTLKDCNGGVCIPMGQCCPGKEESCNGRCIPTADCCSDMECAASVPGQVCNLTTNKCACPMGTELCTRGGARCIPTTGACCDNADCTGGQICGPDNKCSCPPAAPMMCMTPTGVRCGACCPPTQGCGAQEVCTASFTCACATGFRRCGGAGPCVECCSNSQCSDPAKPMCISGVCMAPPGPPPPPPPPPMTMPPGTVP